VKKFVLIGVLAIALLVGAASFATAGPQTYIGTGSPNSSAVGTVTVSATVNPLLKMTITAPDAGQTVAYGSVDPGVTSGIKTVNVAVDSNRAFDLTKLTTGQSAQLGLVTTLGASAGVAGAAVSTPGNNFADNYTITPPYTTAPGTYTAYVTYTALQK
jgi:hypothetical protein